MSTGRSTASEAIKGICPKCNKPIQGTEAHERVYKHRQCSSSPQTFVFVLVKTSDREDVPVPHYECGATSEVIGVYRSYGQAERAKAEITKDWEAGDDDGFFFHQGSNFCSTFEIFAEEILGIDEDSEDED